MSFGTFQIVVISLVSYAAYMLKLKSAVTAFLVLPVLAGLVILYALPCCSRGTTSSRSCTSRTR
ncbi:hypothetical protein B0H10DRAFT_1979757 [Mycena sp. CBHHK59/15]|nr:hypothetical protein B0H10DRAFT_1979757 [Mycena sp. CBHHK59/15]